MLTTQLCYVNFLTLEYMAVFGQMGGILPDQQEAKSQDQ